MELLKELHRYKISSKKADLVPYTKEGQRKLKLETFCSLYLGLLKECLCYQKLHKWGGPRGLDSHCKCSLSSVVFYFMAMYSENMVWHAFTFEYCCIILAH